jgi:hypothetical protein
MHLNELPARAHTHSCTHYHAHTHPSPPPRSQFPGHGFALYHIALEEFYREAQYGNRRTMAVALQELGFYSSQPVLEHALELAIRSGNHQVGAGRRAMRPAVAACTVAACTVAACTSLSARHSLLALPCSSGGERAGGWRAGAARALLGPSAWRHRARVIIWRLALHGKCPVDVPVRPSTRINPATASKPIPPASATCLALPSQVFAKLVRELYPHAVGDPDLRLTTALALKKAIWAATPACKRELSRLGLDVAHEPACTCGDARVGLALVCGSVVGAVAMWATQQLIAASPRPRSSY